MDNSNSLANFINFSTSYLKATGLYQKQEVKVVNWQFRDESLVPRY